MIRRLLPLLLVLLLLLTGCQGQKAQETDNALHFFHNNPCETCHEDRVFAELAAELLPGETYTLDTHYIYDSGARAALQALLDRYGTPEDITYPLLVVRGQYLFGYDEMRERLADVWKGAKP